LKKKQEHNVFNKRHSDIPFHFSRSTKIGQFYFHEQVNEYYKCDYITTKYTTKVFDYLHRCQYANLCKFKYTRHSKIISWPS